VQSWCSFRKWILCALVHAYGVECSCEHADLSCPIVSQEYAECLLDVSCTSVNVKALADVVSWMPWVCASTGIVALSLTGLSLWYTFELAFLDKKASKHARRHRHNKHRIPWHKIKVIGPTMNCGAGDPKTNTGSTSKCPIMH